MTPDAGPPDEVTEEVLAPTRTDHVRFLAAVTGHEVTDPEELPLTSSFLPFAMPTWRLVGAADLPDDGASPEALPGLHGRTEGVMGMGQELTVTRTTENTAELERTSRCVADERREGRSGAFRLLTIRRTTGDRAGEVATQVERFALRERP